MIIKKHPNKNEYLLTDNGLWIRNYTKSLTPYVDINKLIKEEEHSLFLKNEIINNKNRYPWIDGENFLHEKIVIVSDGYNFNLIQKELAKLKKSVTIIAVNGALSKWTENRPPNYYIVNNPYRECMHYIPSRIFPTCISSTRTNFEFLEKYRGTKYRYLPVSDNNYCGTKTNEIRYQIDDYRNPICAAIGLSYRFGVRKLLLACCDDSFVDERPGAERLDNNLWQYPLQRVNQGFIDGNLYWLIKNNREIMVRNCSSGPEYKFAPYISKEEICKFLEDN